MLLLSPFSLLKGGVRRGNSRAS